MSLEELVSACNQHFKDKRLCLGSFIGADDQVRVAVFLPQSLVYRLLFTGSTKASRGAKPSAQEDLKGLP